MKGKCQAEDVKQKEVVNRSTKEIKGRAKERMRKERR
jgi:hypothetical protein